MALPGESVAADDLRGYFGSRLPARVAEVEAARDAARDAGWSGEPLRTFHRLAHSLAGAGATFGFPEVTALARRIEALLKAAVKAESPPDETERREIDDLLVSLREIAGAPFAEGPPEKAGSLPGISGGDHLVYLCSESPGFREVLAFQLRPFGYEVLAFSDPAALREEAERRPPAIVLLDCDGGEQGLRRLDGLGAGPRRVFLSSRGDLPARLAAVRAGCDAYLTKPVEVGLLAETLDRLHGGTSADPFRVLIVEDDADLAAVYSRALAAAGMETCVVSDPMQVMAPLAHLQPDLVLMDLYMPGCTGPELAAVLRQQEGYFSTPIVYLSTEEGIEEQIAAINAGGDEFLTKPIAPGHLVAAVEARARRGRLLATRMSYDGLTGLLNHSHLKQQLEVEVARASREGWEVAYAMIDLDRFKAINDAFGHAAGDRLLKSLARLLRQRLRRSDVLGRYGGDELAAILPHTDGATAVRILEEIRSGFARLHVNGGSGTAVTLSCGVAVYPAYATPQELVEAADAALYEAKRGGRNRVVLRE